jgi:hypothetical protein
MKTPGHRLRRLAGRDWSETEWTEAERVDETSRSDRKEVVSSQSALHRVVQETSH